MEFKDHFSTKEPSNLHDCPSIFPLQVSTIVESNGFDHKFPRSYNIEGKFESTKECQRSCNDPQIVRDGCPNDGK